MQSRGRPGVQVTRQQAFQLIEDDPRSIDDGKPVFGSVEKKSYYAENAMASGRRRRESSMALVLVEDATALPLTATRADTRHGWTELYSWMPWFS